jgi:hypothetical protein
MGSKSGVGKSSGVGSGVGSGVKAKNRSGVDFYCQYFGKSANSPSLKHNPT